MSSQRKKSSHLFTSIVLFLIATDVASYECGAYCNATGFYIASVDCGDLAWCCGVSQERYCCSDYFEHLYEAETNVTVEHCAGVREEYLEDLERSGTTSLHQVFSQLFILALSSIFVAHLRRK